MSARALLRRVFALAEHAWEEHDAALGFGDEFRSMKDAFERWGQYAALRVEKHLRKASEQVSIGALHSQKSAAALPEPKQA